MPVIFNTHGVRRRANVVSVDTRLWTGGTGVRISTGAIDFQIYSSSRPTLQPFSLLYQGYRDSFPRVKGEESDVDYSPAFTAEDKNEWIWTSEPPIRLNGVNRYSLAFYLTLGLNVHGNELRQICQE